MFTQVTSGIRISVSVQYVPEQSFPEDSVYMWVYHVIVENQSGKTLQLASRYWKITNGYGEVSEVKGKGVVGEQPIMQSGTAFEYTSSCQLKTDSGIMQGHYLFLGLDGSQIIAQIPDFSLDIPYNIHAIN